MAKGTKYSDVNFSVPEGADPLGIGVPDLGRSTYDPIATIQQGWEATRQERLIRGDRDQATYQQYLKSMPTVEGVNQEISKKLNKKMVRMGGLFKQRQEAGPFGKWAKTPEGESTVAELSRLENEIASEIPIYNHYSEQYGKDQAVMRNPNNRDKIDWDLTNENVRRMTEAENVEGFVQPFAENAGSLVVMRPEEADMIGWVKSSIDTFAPGMDSSILAQGKDPNTGKWKTTTLETKDQKRVYDAIVKGYANAPRAVQNQIQRMYDAAPKAEKTDANGVVLEPDTWYASQFAPEYGMAKKQMFTTIDDDTKQKTAAPGYGIPRVDGKIDLPQLTTTMRMKTPVQQTAKTVKRKTLRGKMVYNEPTTQDAAMDADYSTISVPLVGFDKTFEMYNHADAIDTSTGKRPDQTASSTHKAVRLDFIPVWRGEKQEVPITETDENGNITTTTWTLNPGDKIPMHVQEQLQDQRASFNYEPFLMTSNVYGPAIEQKALAAGLTWEDYVSRHGKTTVTPWEKSKRELLTKMKAEKYDPAELERLITEIDQQLNGIEDIFK
jgi:hypothetical protein